MIQRIQTIFLVLTALVFGALFKMPFATSDQPSAQFLADKVFDITDHPALLIITGLGSLMALISIFLYKNRKLQLKFGYLNIVLAILLLIIAYLLYTNDSSKVNSTVHIHEQFGIFLPIGAILFSALANYFIRKDDQLVKSMDRLR